MLVACPDCAREVSSRAKACPGCGFPIAEHLAELASQAAADDERKTRAQLGEVDCAVCEARGFRTFPSQDDPTQMDSFAWCEICEHSGRVVLCRSSRGYFAVAHAHVDAFLAGTRDDDGELVVFLGAAEPGPHRYSTAGQRVAPEDE